MAEKRVSSIADELKHFALEANVNLASDDNLSVDYDKIINEKYKRVGIKPQ